MYKKLKIMKPLELQNTTIVALEAVTNVNSVAKNSRFTGSEFTLGNVVFERNDGVFFENVVFDGNEWRPFLRFSTNIIELSNMNKKNACPILVKTFKIK